MDEVYKALDVNLEEPLKTEEQMEPPRPYTIQQRPRMLNLPGFSQPTTMNGGDSLEPYNCTLSPELGEKKKKKVKTANKGQKEKKLPKKKVSGRTDSHHAMRTKDWLDTEEAKEAAAKALKKTHKSPAKRSDVESRESRKRGKVKMVDEPIDKDVYEAAPGICTPSNPNLHFGSGSSNGALTPQDTAQHKTKMHERTSKLKLSSYKILGETEDLKLVRYFAVSC
ncbi:unnamed protein product [Gongylonema pulchrum]|uniref:BLVR domain-containing protein n=1 Tax=Gongylonema pulchrum TaxID=637853 RepID=A0A183EJG7_9BILA|nr:unnamed protein product [Gongylonema pulchrum]